MGTTTKYSLVEKIIRMLMQPELLLRSLRRRLRISKRIVDACIMMVLLQVWPEQVYRFSTRKVLPPKRERYPKPEKTEIPYDVIESRTSDDLPHFEELNLVMRGASFNMGQLENLADTIGLVSFWPKSLWHGQYDSEYYAPFNTNREILYLNSQSTVVRELLQLNQRVLWLESCYVDEVGRVRPQDGNRDESWYEELIKNPLCKRISMRSTIDKGGAPLRIRPPSGTALFAVCAGYLLADVINIYGWDYYLERTPAEMSYWRLFAKLYSYDRDKKGPRVFVETGVVSFYYGYHLAKMAGINNYGYLGQLQSHDRLIRKLERVLFLP